MDQTDFLEQAPVFQLKGSMVTLTTLELINSNLQQLEQQLAEQIAKAPAFFHDAPLILALDKRQDPASELELPKLLEVFSKHNLHIMALRANREQDIQAAAKLKLPVLPPSLGKELNQEPAAKAVEEPAPSPEPQETQQEAKVITHPVRSGQQIYAKNSDLIVLAPVSAGAELLADGHIHVYAPLRGRALAGVNGNEKARIFCQQLGAELVCIAGQYKIAEDLRRIPTWGSASQIYLQEQQMFIEAM